MNVLTDGLWVTHCQHLSPLLIHWGRVLHICVNKLNIIGSDNDLFLGRRQAIIWTNFSEKLIEIHIFSFTKMHVQISSAKRGPFWLDLNVLTQNAWIKRYELIKCFSRLVHETFVFKVLYVEFHGIHPQQDARSREIPLVKWEMSSAR